MSLVWPLEHALRGVMIGARSPAALSVAGPQSLERGWWCQPHPRRWSVLPAHPEGSLSGRPSMQVALRAPSPDYRRAMAEDRCAAALAGAGFGVRRLHGEVGAARPRSDDPPGLDGPRWPRFLLNHPADSAWGTGSFFYECLTPIGPRGAVVEALQSAVVEGRARRFVIHLDGVREELTPQDLAELLKAAQGALGPARERCIEAVLVVRGRAASALYYRPLGAG